jgi:hypothetical protein
MLSGHTLAKTFRQWGLVISTGVAGFALGVALFTVFGLDGIFRALNAVPPIVAGIGLSALLALAFLAIGLSPSRRNAGAIFWRGSRSTT